MGFFTPPRGSAPAMYDASLEAGWGWRPEMSIDDGIAFMIRRITQLEERVAELESDNLADH